MPVVRSSHDGRALKNDWRHRYLMKNATDLYLPVSQLAAEKDIKTFKLNPDKVKVFPPAIDTDHFDPSRSFKDMRKEQNIPTGKTVRDIITE